MKFGLNQRLRFAALAIMLVLGSACAKADDCQKSNEQLEQMPISVVTFTRADGSKMSLDVKTANNNRTRAAGVQRVCASTIAAQPILFLFDRPLNARFHMRNVVAPLAIAFFDTAGKIDSIQAMQPYVIGSKKKPLYGASQPVIGALETYPGFFKDNKIDASASIAWQAK